MSTLNMGGALLNGGTVEWWTPPEIFTALGLVWPVALQRLEQAHRLLEIDA